MNNTFSTRPSALLATAVAALSLAACSNMGGGMSGGMNSSGMSASTSAAPAMSRALTLTGAEEVPPVMTQASGSGSIKVEPEGGVSGSVTTTGLAGTMAHIHIGAPGVNGPVIVPLVQSAPGVWSVPPNAKLTTEQRKAYLDGGLYVNVHSDKNKGGEIRAQLKP